MVAPGIKPEWLLLIKVGLLVMAFSGMAALFVIDRSSFVWMPAMVAIYITVDLYRMMRKAQEEVTDFAESIRYRDFSRSFNIKEAPSEVQILRRGFNDINSAFRLISREKETQYLYLQQILELVDIGIISFQIETGEQHWMNRAFRQMLDIPYLKNIEGLAKREAGLYDEIMAIRPGETRIVEVHAGSKPIKIAMAATVFNVEGIVNKLIAFQNVNLALDETESRAWQRLLSVMTHEIMNSVAPISSLAATLKNRVAETSIHPAGDTVPSDLELGLETIQRRSEGLLKFAETYRSLNKIQNPNLEEVYVRDVFETLITLMQPTMDQKQINLEVILKDPKITGRLDVNLVEQVLINLVINATDAVKDQPAPVIVLSSFHRQGRLVIRIGDNGCGISEELLDKIFIPFFSTKRSGSGIGLSLCKQIMLLHKGNIQVQSRLGEGTVFELEFPI